MDEHKTGARMGPAATPARRWGYRGLGLARSPGEVPAWHVVTVLLACFTVWGYVDIRRRGEVLAGHPELHRTDVTVFTEAGAAFFDGRNPYEVENPRGWTYLYPPLFGLTAAPMSGLDTVSQTLLFYAASVALGFGAFYEARRLWRLLAGGGLDPRLASWVVACAGLAVALPTLECLQRGQVGIALAYAMLLGLRLVLEARGRAGLALAGLVLAWPVAVKLIPALPVGYLVWQSWGSALRRDRRGARGGVAGASALSLGVAAGLALFLLVVPAAVLGWGRNLGYLRTWADKVVHSTDAGKTGRFFIDSTTNQSLANAAYRLSEVVRPVPPDAKTAAELRFARSEAERRWAGERAAGARRRADVATRRLVRAAQAVVVALLLWLGPGVRRGDAKGRAASFGLACAAMLLISPVAWTHYHMMALPAFLFVPLCLAGRGRVLAARVTAAVPAALVLAHFALKPWAGPVGLLGLGLSAWFFAAAGLLLAPGRGVGGREGQVGVRQSRRGRAVAARRRSRHHAGNAGV